MSISAHSKKGKRIFEFLKKELQIPDGTFSLDVHLAIDSAIVVDVSYYPTDGEEHKAE